MKHMRVATRSEWRKWLAENHAREREGVWLVLHKKQAGKAFLTYEEALQEALCFGWIDSILRNLNATTYCRKFSPRKDNSRWSNANKSRVGRLIETGAMTGFGVAKIEAAKKRGNWEIDPRPVISLDPPRELAEALARNRKANDFFAQLAPSCRKQFIGWIVTAKTEKTRAHRVRESLKLLESGQKLGLK